MASRHRDVHFNQAAAGDRAGRRYIAAIGIDHYSHWQSLSNAASDARGALHLFGRLGFEEVVPPLYDERATGQAIRSLVTDDLIDLHPNDSLVLFYAGHGGNRSHYVSGRLIRTGYLVPFDAAVNRAATWIELSGWLRSVSLLPARHILVILDACYSGIALDPVLKWRNDLAWLQAPLSALSARRSRRVITSALGDQRALDHGPVRGHSLFTGCLIEALEGSVTRGDRSYTTGSEIGVYLQNRVRTYPGARQVPDFGTFDLDDRGEIVIPSLGADHSQAAAPDPYRAALSWLSTYTDPEPFSSPELLRRSAPTPYPTVDTDVDVDPNEIVPSHGPIEFDTDPVGD